MNLSVTEHNVRIAVIAPRSAIDPFTSPELRERLLGLLADGVACLIIDLSETPFMDSAGMAVLVTALKRARLGGGNVKLVRPRSDAAMRILTLTRFDQVFDMADSAEAALAAWKRA